MKYQTQHNFIMFITVLGQHVSVLIESSAGPSENTEGQDAQENKLRAINDIDTPSLSVQKCSHSALEIRV